jgi:hypothetical protein
MGEFMNHLLNFEPAPKPEPETLETPAEPVEVDMTDDEYERKAAKINSAYEAVYTFITSLNLAEGEHLDSCKYYASEIASNIYQGTSLISKR